MPKDLKVLKLSDLLASNVQDVYYYQRGQPVRLLVEVNGKRHEIVDALDNFAIVQFSDARFTENGFYGITKAGKRKRSVTKGEVRG